MMTAPVTGSLHQWMSYRFLVSWMIFFCIPLLDARCELLGNSFTAGVDHSLQANFDDIWTKSIFTALWNIHRMCRTANPAVSQLHVQLHCDFNLLDGSGWKLLWIEIAVHTPVFHIHTRTQQL